MKTSEIAADLIRMCRLGWFAEAGEKYWAEDVVSIEFAGVERVARGKAAVRAKGLWWANAHELHAVTAEGPWVNDDRFVVRFVIEVTNKQSGQRMTLDEVGLYTLKDGKIVEERFFFAG